MQLKLDFLIHIGCRNVVHQQRTLLEHLVGTSEKLKNMGAPQYLQDAGLFHSIYGTADFMSDQGAVSFDDRDKIRELIGEQAEEIAYWFCIMESPRFEQIQKMSGQLKEDLLLLHKANEDDMADHMTMSWDEAYGV